MNERTAMIATLALAVAQHRGRTVTPIHTVPVDETIHERDCAYVTSDGPAPCTCRAIHAYPATPKGYRIEHAQHDPDEYPVLVFDDPPAPEPPLVDDYPPPVDPFDRDEFWWRRRKT